MGAQHDSDDVVPDSQPEETEAVPCCLNMAAGIPEREHSLTLTVGPNRRVPSRLTYSPVKPDKTSRVTVPSTQMAIRMLEMNITKNGQHIEELREIQHKKETEVNGIKSRIRIAERVTWQLESQKERIKTREWERTNT